MYSTFICLVFHTLHFHIVSITYMIMYRSLHTWGIHYTLSHTVESLIEHTSGKPARHKRATLKKNIATGIKLKVQRMILLKLMENNKNLRKKTQQKTQGKKTTKKRKNLSENARKTPKPRPKLREKNENNPATHKEKI